MTLASFEQAFRLQQRDANTKESKDTVQSQMTSRFVGLPCCSTIICDNAFLPTQAKYECQAPSMHTDTDYTKKTYVFSFLVFVILGADSQIFV